MNFVETFSDVVLSVIRTPKVFFKDIAKERSLKPAVVYLLMLLLVGTLFRSLSDIFLQPSILQWIANYFQINFTKPVLTLDTIFYYIIISCLTMIFLVGPIYSLIVTILLHIWLKVFRGKGTLKQTAQLYIYSMTPVFLLNWVPVVGFATWFYGVYLLVIGSERLHGLTRKRALIAFGIPMIIFVVFTIIRLAATIKILQNSPQQ